MVDETCDSFFVLLSVVSCKVVLQLGEISPNLSFILMQLLNILVVLEELPFFSNEDVGNHWFAGNV